MKTFHGFRALCISFFITMVSVQSHAGEISVAAASDLTYCLEELNAAFHEKNPGVTFKVSNGSSGNFFEQIRNGAPFDVFLSADMNYPKELAKAGQAEEKSIMQYATGRIVLWSTNSRVDVSKGLEILRDARLVKKIAIANPDHAPYGRAAKAALEHYDIWKAIGDRIVTGENISQTAQFVQTGNADAGIVALSLVMSPKLAKVGTYYLIPIESYPPLEQGGVLTKSGKTNPDARAYMEFLGSDAARRIFDKYGFTLTGK